MGETSKSGDHFFFFPLEMLKCDATMSKVTREGEKLRPQKGQCVIVAIVDWGRVGNGKVCIDDGCGQ